MASPLLNSPALSPRHSPPPHHGYLDRVLPAALPPLAPRTPRQTQNKAATQAMGGKFAGEATIHLLLVIWPRSRGEVGAASPPLLSVSNPCRNAGERVEEERRVEEAKRMDVLKGHCLADHLHINKRELQSMRRLVRIKSGVKGTS